MMAKLTAWMRACVKRQFTLMTLENGIILAYGLAERIIIMNGKQILKSVTALCISVNTIGCSCFVPWNQDFVVAGTPNDAEIVIRGEGSKRAGEAYLLRRNRSYAGEIRRDGYETEQFYVSPEVSVWGGLDIVGGCVVIVPFIGLCFPGSHTLSKDHYFYNLKPIQQ